MSCASGTIARPDPARLGLWQYLRPDCKKLSCPHCGPWRAYQIRKAILTRAIEHKLTRLMTLTLDPKKLPPGCETVAYIRNSWAKFRVYLQRAFHRPIKFIAILEFQKNGNAHLHILIDQYIENTWLSEQWQAVGGGKIVDIRVVDMHRIALYLSKYLTKELLNTCPPGKRRVSACRAFVLFAKRVPGGWRFLRTSFWVFYNLFAEGAADVELDAQGESYFVSDSAPGDENPIRWKES